jgi:hypothetical protein
MRNKLFHTNMFGYDFNMAIIEDDPIKLETYHSGELKDITMKMLQEKSFKGLYLRLQFWINQIYKCLYNKNSGCRFGLQKTHMVIMKSIIAFLSYMRDIVWELKVKQITDIESYEWQKQIRLTWNATEPGCKIECGGWSSYQGNEYLGSDIRSPITPLTNRYFVFASAALREKSAVMFK